MKILLDTHVLLWWFFDDKRLSAAGHSLIADIDVQIMVSSVSAWEISTKHRLGKLPDGDRVIENLPDLLVNQSMDELLMTIEHAIVAGNFDVAHRDPFDRMLAAQSKLEDIPLLTSDKAFEQFDIETIW